MSHSNLQKIGNFSVNKSEGNTTSSVHPDKTDLSENQLVGDKSQNSSFGLNLSTLKSTAVTHENDTVDMQKRDPSDSDIHIHRM